MNVPPFYGDDDPTWVALPLPLKVQIDLYVWSPDYSDDFIPCIWLKDGKCQHYEYRPEICREFECPLNGSDHETESDHRPTDS